MPRGEQPIVRARGEKHVSSGVGYFLLGSALPLSERLTGLKFGLNPDIADERVLPFMGAGMFSFSMGTNLHLGGDLEMPFNLFLTLSGATVHVDGRAVVDRGTLRLRVGDVAA